MYALLFWLFTSVLLKWKKTTFIRAITLIPSTDNVKTECKLHVCACNWRNVFRQISPEQLHESKWLFF